MTLLEFLMTLRFEDCAEGRVVEFVDRDGNSGTITFGKAEPPPPPLFQIEWRDPEPMTPEARVVAEAEIVALRETLPRP